MRVNALPLFVGWLAHRGFVCQGFYRYIIAKNAAQGRSPIPLLKVIEHPVPRDHQIMSWDIIGTEENR